MATVAFVSIGAFLLWRAVVGWRRPEFKSGRLTPWLYLVAAGLTGLLAVLAAVPWPDANSAEFTSRATLTLLAGLGIVTAAGLISVGERWLHDAVTLPPLLRAVDAPEVFLPLPAGLVAAGVAALGVALGFGAPFGIDVLARHHPEILGTTSGLTIALAVGLIGLGVLMIGTPVAWWIQGLRVRRATDVHELAVEMWAEDHPEDAARLQELTMRCERSYHSRTRPARVIPDPSCVVYADYA